MPPKADESTAIEGEELKKLKKEKKEKKEKKPKSKKEKKPKSKKEKKNKDPDSKMPPKAGDITDIESGAPRRMSSLFADRDGCHLEFSNIALSTKSKNAEKNPPKEILKGLSGTFQPKTLTAIMGPSGSGKTSLLKVLTGRIGKSNLDLSGEIELDHKVVDPSNIDVRRSLAYVEQDVSIPPTCTPREAITFSARLRLDKSVTDEEIDTVVNDILDNLGLQGCADTLIGGGPLMSGGLSGGEKKRVQCGVELVTNPQIILLDEPTSGLDSYSAQSLMDVLKKIADAGATVIVTIHQPPPPIVRKIDNTLLMLGGRIMYDGPMGDVLEKKFTKAGFPKPDDYNIADWMLVRSLTIGITVWTKNIPRDCIRSLTLFFFCTIASRPNKFERRFGQGWIL